VEKIILVLFVIIGVGCSSPSAPQLSSAYPGPDSAAAYPGSSGVKPATRTPLPTPSSSTGNVTGRLVNKDLGTSLQGLTIYLGDLVPMQNSQGNLVTLSQNASPHATVDANGYFALLNIKPGIYPLIVWTPISSKVITDPQRSEQEYRVIVKPGEAVDVGEMNIEWP
jgi:hypothetical protein